MKRKECEKPHKSPIDEQNNKFYYQGKFFEKEEDFFEYVKKFNLKQTTAEDFDRLFDMLKKDIWMNLEMRRTEITNSELRCLLEETFQFILNRIDENATKCDQNRERSSIVDPKKWTT